ncbi:MAG: group 1 glycosyl transferase [Epsilonproteobacteria bacterium]|nr:MAG: group 1 glycosyl transferase [Campylobacterota bacterium]
MQTKKILIVSHAHPKFSKGGGEIAAYNMYQELNRQGYDTYFLAAHNNEKAHHGHTPFSVINEKEILFFMSSFDYFLQTSYNKITAWKDFRKLLEMIQPDIIHFHHYIHLGLEKIREAHRYKEKRGNVKIILTLHEYIAICANNGQMVKRDTDALCYASNYVDCSKCFPDKNPTDFFMRDIYIKSFFELVDHFISPSHFLIQRYIDWGLNRENFLMFENGQVPVEGFHKSKKTLGKSKKRATFAYFGQINIYKGLDILLEALDYLDKSRLKHLRLHIHGSGIENQPEVFQKKIKTYFKKYKENIIFFGNYEIEELPDFMENVDWVIVPSSWWENSPLVIQEAFKFGRPMIVSDIGGMAEKVIDGKNGLHFKVRNPRSLAEKLTQAISDIELYDKLYDGISEPLTIEESIWEHLGVYKDENN